MQSDLEPKPVADLIHEYFAAYEAKNWEMLEPLLTEDFRFSSPLDDHIGRAVYFVRCWPNRERVRRLKIEKIFVQENEAFVLYELIPITGPGCKNIEFFRFDGDKIKEVEVYFGRETSPPSLA